MTIASWNINGLRSVAKHGFASWLAASNIDILCVQEIKLNAHQLTPELTEIDGYKSMFNHASTPGYAGTGIFSKLPIISIDTNPLGHDQATKDGRTMLVEFDTFAVLNLYLPHGGRDQSKLAYKLEMYAALIKLLQSYAGKPLILAGDFNVAHTDIDLARPKQNRQNTMFTPAERDQLDQIINLGYVDTFRLMNPNLAAYTWWPYLADARARNTGWRIDYIFVPSSMQSQIKLAATLPDVTGSDHGPIVTIIDKKQ